MQINSHITRLTLTDLFLYALVQPSYLSLEGLYDYSTNTALNTGIGL